MIAYHRGLYLSCLLGLLLTGCSIVDYVYAKESKELRSVFENYVTVQFQAETESDSSSLMDVITGNLLEHHVISIKRKEGYDPIHVNQSTVEQFYLIRYTNDRAVAVVNEISRTSLFHRGSGELEYVRTRTLSNYVEIVREDGVWKISDIQPIPNYLGD